jgi:hypothetical protein
MKPSVKVMAEPVALKVCALHETRKMGHQPNCVNCAPPKYKNVCQYCKAYCKETKQCTLPGNAMKYVPRKGTCGSFSTK